MKEKLVSNTHSKFRDYKKINSVAKLILSGKSSKSIVFVKLET
jgi:hypothetical protein